jgi:DNA-binding NtrC family response regulator
MVVKYKSMNTYLKFNLLKGRLLNGIVTDRFSKPEFSNKKILISKKSVIQAPVAARTILIVDSEPNILRLLYSVLSPVYQIVLKKQAVEAISWLEEGNKPAMVITEFNHKHFTAVQFISYFKSSGFFQDIPILILTENSNVTQEIAAISKDVACIMQKPFNPTILKDTIKTIFNEQQLSVIE